MLRSRLLTCSLGLLAILCVAMAAPAGAEMVPTGSTSQSSQSARQAGRVTASTPAPAAPFSGVAPARLFDTRSTGGTIDGIGQGGGAFAGTRSVQVTGRGEVPLAGVGAVVLNLTVTNPATDGYTTVFPGGSARPNASSVNFSAGSTVPNAVIAKVGPTGSVSIYNSTRADVIIDVSGWIPDDADYTGADPARFTDTRSGRTTVDGQEQGRGAFSGVRKVQLAGRGGIPSSGVGAVVLNLTITGSAGEGYSTIYPGGEARPATSNLNFIKGGTRASLVIVKVGESGTAELFNSVRADAIVDVLGWFPSGSDYSSLVPARLVDTRPGRQTTDGLEIGAGAFSGTRSFVVADRAGVPADAGAVVLNVTVTGSGASGYTTEFVTGETIPKTSNLNYNKGQSAANLVIARIGVNGQVNIFNSSSAHIVIDVLGWLPKSPAGPDAKAGTTGMVSVASDGTQANNGSISSAVSADGRYVAYMGDASNLVPNDTNGEFDVFLYDRHTATTTRVSVGAGGVQANGSSYYPTLSADGRYIAYSSDATNLVEGDTNDEADVFVYDQLAKVATRVSVASDGGQSDGSSYQPSISGDGTVVAFVSVASNLVAGDSNGAADVYVHDRESGSTTRVSISDNGDEAEADSSKPSISGDGLSVAFESMASNLVADDTNSAMDIFVRDLAATTTSRVSVSTAGAQGDGDSQRSSISSDGRYIAFDSYSENFVSDELKGTPNVFVHDREVGTTTLVSATPELSPSDGVSVGPKISADGGSIAYRSTSADLVVGGSDPNNGFQVFVYDRETASTILVSAASATNEAVESTEEVAISADGGVISYTGFGFGTVWSDPLPSADIYVWVRRS